MKQHPNRNRGLFCVALLACVILLGSGDIAHAANLSVVPAGASGSYSVGQVFSVSVFVSTADGESMNAVSGTLSYPANLLQVVSLDKTASIVDFWIGDPSYANGIGQVQFGLHPRQRDDDDRSVQRRHQLHTGDRDDRDTDDTAGQTRDRTLSGRHER